MRNGCSAHDVIHPDGQLVKRIAPHRHPETEYEEELRRFQVDLHEQVIESTNCGESNRHIYERVAERLG